MVSGADYLPIDLVPHCNVGVAFLGASAQPPLGQQIFHGLPFCIGPAEAHSERCFVGFDGVGAANITIPIDARPRHLIFAHTLLGTRIPEGEVIGRLIAHYTFHFADGETVRVPIRERFEISSGPMIHLSVEGSRIGDTLQLAGPGTVAVEAWAESIFPIHTLQIVEQGRVVAESNAEQGAGRHSPTHASIGGYSLRLCTTLSTSPRFHSNRPSGPRLPTPSVWRNSLSGPPKSSPVSSS